MCGLLIRLSATMEGVAFWHGMFCQQTVVCGIKSNNVCQIASFAGESRASSLLTGARQYDELKREIHVKRGTSNQMEAGKMSLIMGRLGSIPLSKKR